jgi:hypothetical protein
MSNIHKGRIVIGIGPFGIETPVRFTGYHVVMVLMGPTFKSKPGFLPNVEGTSPLPFAVKLFLFTLFALFFLLPNSCIHKHYTLQISDPL